MARRRWSLPRLLEGYYWATPLFVAVDLFFSAPIRVAALGDSNLRWAYYGLLLVFGAVCRRRPSWAAGVGMAESAVNVFLLVLAILLPVWDAATVAEAGSTPAGPFDEVGLLNFLVSGSVFLLAYYRSQLALFGGR